MTKDPINKEWLISAGYGALDSKTGLNVANGLHSHIQTLALLA